MSVGDRIMDSLYWTSSEFEEYQRDCARQKAEEAANQETDRKWKEYRDIVEMENVQQYVKEQEKRMGAMEDCIKGLEAKLKRK